jgi:hypothetical protein
VFTCSKNISAVKAEDEPKSLTTKDFSRPVFDFFFGKQNQERRNILMLVLSETPASVHLESRYTFACEIFFSFSPIKWLKQM